jgi:hypothetical protein
MVPVTAIRFIVLKAVKVRIYPNIEQQSHLVQAKGLCPLGVESIFGYDVPNLQRNWERRIGFDNEETDSSMENRA